MKMSPLFLVAIVSTLATLPGKAADDPAVLKRMAGTYSDKSVIFRQQMSGNPDSFFDGSMTLRMPRGKGTIFGTLRATGQIFPLTGRVSSAKVVGKTVRYSGRLSLTSPGAILSQKSFRATATPQGNNREVLSASVKLSGLLGGVTPIVISNGFRGTK